MKATFQDFIMENPSCSGLTDNTEAQEVFELLSQDENIIRMLELSDQQQPALAACVKQLKAWREAGAGQNFPFRSDKNAGEDYKVKVDFNKKAVGRMVKTILAPFGYTVTTRKAISPRYGSEDFSSAACYSRDQKVSARLMVKKQIVSAEEDQ